MSGLNHANVELDAKDTLNDIVQTVYQSIKSCGFRKHGRILHRFASDDISQVIHFQTGQAYRKEAHLLFVNVGIRIPECMSRCFTSEEGRKKYYPEYECNIRSRLGLVENSVESVYDLRQGAEEITVDILRQLRETVIPVFDILNSRDAILLKRREYPQFDRINNHLILLEEAMIYGRRGDRENAEEAFRRHYHIFSTGQTAQNDMAAIRNHLAYLDGLAARLGIEL